VVLGDGVAVVLIDLDAVRLEEVVAEYDVELVAEIEIEDVALMLFDAEELSDVDAVGEEVGELLGD